MLRNFIMEEDGIGTIEMILIMVVLIGLIILFRDKLTTIMNTIFDKITKQSNSV